MSALGLVLVGVFLPLFPFSIAFNALLERLTKPLQRSALLLVWPQIGVLALSVNATAIPSWFVTWAILSSLLYAFRLLAMREMGRWVGFLATSAWALLWPAAYAGIPPAQLWTFAAGFTIPLIFVTLLAQVLERQFGAAYIGLYGGLARRTRCEGSILSASIF